MWLTHENSTRNIFFDSLSLFEKTIKIFQVFYMSDTLLSALTFDMLSSLILIVLYIRYFTLQNENTNLKEGQRIQVWWFLELVWIGCELIITNIYKNSISNINKDFFFSFSQDQDQWKLSLLSSWLSSPELVTVLMTQLLGSFSIHHG